MSASGGEVGVEGGHQVAGLLVQVREPVVVIGRFIGRDDPVLVGAVLRDLGGDIALQRTETGEQLVGIVAAGRRGYRRDTRRVRWFLARWRDVRAGPQACPGPWRRRGLSARWWAGLGQPATGRYPTLDR